MSVRRRRSPAVSACAGPEERDATLCSIRGIPLLEAVCRASARLLCAPRGWRACGSPREVRIHTLTCRSARPSHGPPSPTNIENPVLALTPRPRRMTPSESSGRAILGPRGETVIRKRAGSHAYSTVAPRPLPAWPVSCFSARPNQTAFAELTREWKGERSETAHERA